MIVASAENVIKATKTGANIDGVLGKGVSNSLDDIGKAATHKDVPHAPSKANGVVREHGHKDVNSDFRPASNNINKASNDIFSTSHYQHTFATTHSANNFHSKKMGEIITTSNIHHTPLKMEVESKVTYGLSKEASNKIDDVVIKKETILMNVMLRVQQKQES